MAFGRKASLTASAETKAQQPKTLVASAIRTNLSDLSYNLWKFRDEGWQRELWRFYDIIPEFAFAARWVGACCSRVRIYVAEVDRLGRVQGEVKDTKINALADSLLGGPASKSEALRSLGINLTVAGESYIVGRPGDPSGVDSDNPRDEWYVLSPSEMRRVESGNGEWQWAWYQPNGEPLYLDLKRNVITRVWTPHPNRFWCADSPAHACQMILRELEQLTKYVFSQIDSRLVGAGLLIIPNNLDLPLEPGTTNSSDSLMVRLAKAGAASLRGEGSALGVLPNIVESDNAENWKLLSFESQLSNQAMELRKEAVNRLGVGLDMPPEVLMGTGDSNHWCLSSDTEILTHDKGWVKYDQLSVGDLVMTLDHETGTSAWQPAQAVNVFDVQDESMLSLESRYHSSLSTGGHRWPVVKRVPKGPAKGTYNRFWMTSTDTFASDHGVPVAARSEALPTTARYTDEFVKLVAAYTSDGTYVEAIRGLSKIHLTKFQAREISEVRRLISHTFDPYQWSETIEHTATKSYGRGVRFHLRADAAEALHAVAPGSVKAVTSEFIDSLTESQLLLFLDAMLEVGDGIRRGTGYTFFRAERDRLEAVERAAILLGFSVTWEIRDKHSSGSFAKRPLHILQVNYRTATYPSFANPTWVKYTGKVWCPTTANGTWLARRNGKVFYTGNSAYLIDGQGIKVHIEPLMNRICDALTKAYLVPALRLMGKDPSRYTYSYDTSPLQLRPQRLQDALNLYEKQIISAQAVREAAFFKESDSPDLEEDMERFTRELILRNTELLQNEAIREAAGIPQDIISQEDMVAALPPEQMGLPPGGGPPPAGAVPGPNGESLAMNGPPPPPPPPTGIKSALPPPIPDSINEPNMGSQRGMPTNTATPTGIQASAHRKQMEEMGIVVVAEATVRRGLELAGKRLLDRDTRNQFRDVPAHELHTRIRVEDQARVNRLLLGAWDQLDSIANFVAAGFDTVPMRDCLERYCAQLLLTGTHHDPQLLLDRLRKEGVVSAI